MWSLPETLQRGLRLLPEGRSSTGCLPWSPADHNRRTSCPRRSRSRLPRRSCCKFRPGYQSPRRYHIQNRRPWSGQRPFPPYLPRSSRRSDIPRLLHQRLPCCTIHRWYRNPSEAHTVRRRYCTGPQGRPDSLPYRFPVLQSCRRSA